MLIINSFWSEVLLNNDYFVWSDVINLEVKFSPIETPLMNTVQCSLILVYF